MNASTRIRLTAFVTLSLISIGGSSAASAPRSAAGPETSPALLVQIESTSFTQHSPELDVALDFTGDVRIPGRVTIYVPAGFQLYPQRNPGSPIGSVRIYASDYSRTSATFSVLEGDITAEPLSAADEERAQSCSPGSHIALWMVRLVMLRQPLELPIYVSAANSADPTGTMLKLEFCPPAFPGVAAQSGAALPLAQVILSLPGLEAPRARGSYLWRAIVMPLAPDRSTLLPDRAYEVRSLVPVPHRLTLTGRYLPEAHAAMLYGTFRSMGRPRAGVEVELVKLDRAVTSRGAVFRDSFAGTTRTARSGEYSFHVRIRRTTGFVVRAADTWSFCDGASAAPAGCVSTTTSGVRSDPVTVSVPKP